MGKLDVFRPKWGQHITVPVTALAPAIPIGKGVSGANKGGKIMVAYRTIVRGTGLAALGAALAATAPVLAQHVASEDESHVVTAPRENETQFLRHGSPGAIGDKDAVDVPFAVKACIHTLIQTGISSCRERRVHYGSD